MKAKKIIWFRKIFIKFNKLFDNQKLPKVLMLTGKKGQGKFTLINHLMSLYF